MSFWHESILSPFLIPFQNNSSKQVQQGGCYSKPQRFYSPFQNTRSSFFPLSSHSVFLSFSPFCHPNDDRGSYSSRSSITQHLPGILTHCLSLSQCNTRDWERMQKENCGSWMNKPSLTWRLLWSLMALIRSRPTALLSGHSTQNYSYWFVYTHTNLAFTTLLLAHSFQNLFKKRPLRAFVIRQLYLNTKHQQQINIYS